MTEKLFGTDGIRGTSNTWPMTAEAALKVGMASAVQFIRGDHRHQVGAVPILVESPDSLVRRRLDTLLGADRQLHDHWEIGRASCRERG